MSVLSKDQRKSERQQTFYTAFAYVRKGANWSRHTVKVFDQSYTGVRLRSMQNLGGEDLYVQLDMTSPVIALCHVKRVHPVARNCWEFGIELGGLAEIHSIVPLEAIERFCDAGTAQHVSAVIEVPNTTPSPVDELLSLQHEQLGLPQPPAPTTPPNASNEQLSEQHTETTIEPVVHQTQSVDHVEPIADEPTLADEVVATEQHVETQADNETPVATKTLAPEDAIDLLVQTVSEEPGVVEPSYKPQVVSHPEPEPELAQPVPSFDEPVIEPESTSLEQQPIDEPPSAAAINETPLPETHPVTSPESIEDLPAQPSVVELPPEQVAKTSVDEPSITTTPILQVPAENRATFIQTVAVGFSGLAELGLAAIKVPVHAFKQQFTNRKSEEEKRMEWLQICAGTVNPPKK